MKVSSCIIKDFRWLADLVSKKNEEPVPRMLIFFTNLNHLADAYQAVMTYAHQKVGSTEPICVMFHLITDPRIKAEVIADLQNPAGSIKCVFCSSSLSMGVNLSNVKYVIRYGPPISVHTFLQETGRAAREEGSQGHAIMMTFSRMCAGRMIDKEMLTYVKTNECLRNVVLSKFNSCKPADQKNCCSVCDKEGFELVDKIAEQFDSSLTDTFSDSDSIASVGELENI